MSHLRRVLSLSTLGIALYLNPLSTIASGDKAIAVESNSASTPKKIRSNHWTYQSVKSLSDRYRCTAKDQLLATLLQQNQPLNRFELAATLRSCIDQIGDRYVNSQDRRVALALQREFNNEIMTLKAHVGSLEAPHALTLEAQQFSKDTKTGAEVVFGTPDWFQSLKELTERYECITGLNLPWQPKSTDNRYELAWELNSCLDQIMARFGPFKDKDQVIVDKLWAEFKPETQIIRNRIDDVLEVRAKELEAREKEIAQQNPRTTKVFAHRVLPDVNPTQWNAVKSLVLKYNCISGLSSGLFQPDRPTTRYELAAALNACLRRNNNQFATQEDRDLAQSLQQEFKTELAEIRNRTNELEARAAALEFKQFSPTSKLQGQTVITIQGGGF
jgi:hypothetical protein